MESIDKFFWVQDYEHEFLPGKIIDIKNDRYIFEIEYPNGEITIKEGSKEDEYQEVDLNRMKGPDDLLSVGDLNFNKQSLLHNIRNRFLENKIYTFIGDIILVSVNPFKKMDIFNNETKKIYIDYFNDTKISINKQSTRSNSIIFNDFDLENLNYKPPPHIYYMAEAAYQDMISYNMNQSIIISGEAGSGKTVCTNYIIEYFISRNSFKSSNSNNNIQYLETQDKNKLLFNKTLKKNQTYLKITKPIKKNNFEIKKDDEKKTQPSLGPFFRKSCISLKKQIPLENNYNQEDSTKIYELLLYASFILESFGNAKTNKNDNSSRFGKFTMLYFNTKGEIVSAKIINYLLENSRVAKQQYDEKNFHIFYLLCNGSDNEEQIKFHLQPIENFYYLNQSNFCTSASKSDENKNIEGKSFYKKNSDENIIENNFEEKENFLKLKKNFIKLNFTDLEVENIFRVISGLLYLGNIFFDVKINKDSKILQNKIEQKLTKNSNIEEGSENFIFENITENFNTNNLHQNEINDLFNFSMIIPEESQLDLLHSSELLGMDKKSLTFILTDSNKKYILEKVLKNFSTLGSNIKLYKELILKLLSIKRDDIAKTIYSNLFDLIIKKINSQISNNNKTDFKDPLKNNFIGILDIFGFENFELNSFEQLCINYTNERLLQFFNKQIFKNEQKDYLKEKIEWSNVDFIDNISIINMFDNPDFSIFSFLEEFGNEENLNLLSNNKGYENNSTPNLNFATTIRNNEIPNEITGMQNNNTQLSNLDLKFRNMVYESFINTEYDKYLGDKINGFVSINHYAGTVYYDIDGFVEKNNNCLNILKNNEEIISNFRNSDNDIVNNLFAELKDSKKFSLSNKKYSNSDKNPKKITSSKFILDNVSKIFKKKLNKLFEILDYSKPRYIKCIRPSNEKQENTFESTLVIDQLLSNGLLEALKIRSKGYSYRIKHQEFCERYNILTLFSCPENKIKNKISKIFQNENNEQEALNYSNIDIEYKKNKSFIFEPLENNKNLNVLTNDKNFYETNKDHLFNISVDNYFTIDNKETSQFNDIIPNFTRNLSTNFINSSYMNLNTTIGNDTNNISLTNLNKNISTILKISNSKKLNENNKDNSFIKKRLNEEFRKLSYEIINQVKNTDKDLGLLLDFKKNNIQVGVSRIFMKEKIKNILENKRKNAKFILRVQSNVRGLLIRSKIKKILCVNKIINAFHIFKFRKNIFEKIKISNTENEINKKTQNITGSNENKKSNFQIKTFSKKKSSIQDLFMNNNIITKFYYEKFDELNEDLEKSKNTTNNNINKSNYYSEKIEIFNFNKLPRKSFKESQDKLSLTKNEISNINIGNNEIIENEVIENGEIQSIFSSELSKKISQYKENISKLKIENENLINENKNIKNLLDQANKKISLLEERLNLENIENNFNLLNIYSSNNNNNLNISNNLINNNPVTEQNSNINKNNNILLNISGSIDNSFTNNQKNINNQNYIRSPQNVKIKILQNENLQLKKNFSELSILNEIGDLRIKELIKLNNDLTNISEGIKNNSSSSKLYQEMNFLYEKITILDNEKINLLKNLRKYENENILNNLNSKFLDNLPIKNELSQNSYKNFKSNFNTENFNTEMSKNLQNNQIETENTHIYNTDINDLINTITNLKKENKIHKKKISEMNIKKENTIEIWQNEIKQKDLKIEEMIHNKTKIDILNTNLNTKIENLEKNISNLKENLEKMELINLNEKNSENSQKLKNELETKIKSFENQINEKNEKIEDLERENSRFKKLEFALKIEINKKDLEINSKTDIIKKIQNEYNLLYDDFISLKKNNLILISQVEIFEKNHLHNLNISNQKPIIFENPNLVLEEKLNEVEIEKNNLMKNLLDNQNKINYLQEDMMNKNSKINYLQNQLLKKNRIIFNKKKVNLILVDLVKCKKNEVQCIDALKIIDSDKMRSTLEVIRRNEKNFLLNANEDFSDSSDSDSEGVIDEESDNEQIKNELKRMINKSNADNKSKA